MLWGKQDVALGQEMAQPSIDLCDQGELVFFEHATHWLQHDEAAEVSNHLVAFLA
jgi:pimeloyl-ACP methyl ester carboxylesterase